MQYYPVCLFCYNRAHHCKMALATLANAYGASESDLYIFVDGPATPSDRKRVDHVRRIVQEVHGFKSVCLSISEVNLGTVNSIVPRITKILSDHEAVIVLEDDVEVSRNFLFFMNEALKRYRDEPSVMSISGYMFSTPDEGLLPETFFYRKGTSIGWATWRRAWQLLSMDCEALLRRLESAGLMGRLDGDNAIFKLSSLLRRDAAVAGVDSRSSWSPRWFASQILAGGLTLYPRRSLVRNTGFDGSGIRSPISTAWEVSLVNDFLPNQFPCDIVETPGAHAIMTHAYERVDVLRDE